jgi:colanic acid biosynthesis glycosyl transferase WcaI
LIASSPPFFPHISGYLLAKRWRIPLVLEVRDLWPDYLHDMGFMKRGSPAGRFLFALERYLLVRAAHVVVVTESFKTRIASKGVPENRISVIPNGVDHGFYYSEECQSAPVERRDRSSLVVGYLGNFGAGQGLTTVLEAAGILGSSNTGIRFVLVGDGPQRAALEERASELKLLNLTIEPPIPKEKTRQFYNSCDVCLVPLAPVPVFQETVPSKIFEIMACERPVVGCFDGEARRIVEESGAGIVVPPGDSQALAEALLTISNHTGQQMRAMGARGRRYVQARYDRAVLAQRYFALLCGLRKAGADVRSAPEIEEDALSPR